MLDQTVSVNGPDGQTIQIPASQLASDGHIMVDGNKVEFTVEPLTLGGMSDFLLAEDFEDLEKSQVIGCDVDRKWEKR